MKKYYSHNFMGEYDKYSKGVIGVKENGIGFSFDLEESAWEELINKYSLNIDIHNKSIKYYLNVYQNEAITISSHTWKSVDITFEDKVVYEFNENEKEFMSNFVNELLEYIPIIFDNGNLYVKMKNIWGVWYWLKLYANRPLED